MSDTRPRSIIDFERFYLLYFVSKMLVTVLYWDREVAKTARRLAAQQVSPDGAPLLVAISMAIAALIILALWFFVARRGSVVARWLVLALFGYTCAEFVMRLADGRLSMGGSGLPALITLATLGFATWFLFRPDARAWRGPKADGNAA